MPFTFTMPKLSPTMEEGMIVAWHKKENEFVEAGALLLEITTDKATVEHHALDEGWLRTILIHQGETARVNQPLAIFSATKEESIAQYQVEKPVAPKEQVAPASPSITTPTAVVESAPLSQPLFVPEAPLKKAALKQERGERVAASPLAKKLAKEKGLDIASVEGTGPGGRVVAKDLAKAEPEAALFLSRGLQPSIAPGSYEEIALTPMRKIIGKRLQESKSFIPHFYVQKTIDAQPLMMVRKQLKEMGIKVTVNDLMIRAVALALHKHPEINRGFNTLSQKIIQFQTIDISIAVTIEEGLITPIIRHADYKSVGQISMEIKELAERARKGKLQEHEYKGGSFSLSNLGMFGIDSFTAVINPPQAAILAVGGVRESAVVKEGVLSAGEVITVVLSADHRVIDGAQGAQFLATLAKLVENAVGLTL